MTLMERASAKTPLDASADDALLTSLREKVGQIILLLTQLVSLQVIHVRLAVK